MNESQTVFTFFYALYFAITTTVTGKLHPFDTASMWALKPRAWLRILVSFFVLNIIPLMYFLFVFERLGSFQRFHFNFWSLFLLFVLSLSGLGFYRVHYGLMLIKRKGAYFFFDAELYPETAGIPQSFYEDIRNRPELHKQPWPHLGPGLIWSAMSFMLAWWLIN